MTSPEWVLHADGKLEAVSVPEQLQEAARMTGVYAARQGEIVWGAGWWRQTASGGVEVHWTADDRGLVTGRGRDRETVWVRSRDGKPRDIARVGILCDTSQGAPVPRPDGGYWLVHPSGCQVAVDASLARIDPLALDEHLARRGSRGMGWNEQGNVWLLHFVRYGLLLLFGCALALGRLGSGRDRQRFPVLRHPLALAASVYAALGALALRALLPLLG